METDHQAFLNSEMEKAAQNPVSQDELHLVMLHYHQALLQAIQALEPCSSCCSTLDLPILKTRVSDLQHRSFANFQEIMRVCLQQLRDLSHLCPECRQNFQQEIVVRFFEIRNQ